MSAKEKDVKRLRAVGLGEKTIAAIRAHDEALATTGQPEAQALGRTLRETDVATMHIESSAPSRGARFRTAIGIGVLIALGLFFLALWGWTVMRGGS